MNTQPPQIANWLLRHFGSSPNNDAVIGDLNERYRQGKRRKIEWDFSGVGRDAATTLSFSARPLSSPSFELGANSGNYHRFVGKSGRI